MNRFWRWSIWIHRLCAGAVSDGKRFVRMGVTPKIDSRFWIRCLEFALAALVSWLAGPAMVAAARSWEPGTEDCVECHGTGGAHGPQEEHRVSPVVDEIRFRDSAHGVLECTDCHTAAKESPHPSTDMGIAPCRACHDTRVFDESIHGRSSIEESWCVKCHDVHSASLVDSLVAEGHVGICTQCHEDEALMRSHGVGRQWADGYRQSFHGRAIRLGDRRVADCVSCHTAHDVRSSRDPRSGTHRRNLLRTCRTDDCHPHATPAFLRGSPHGIYKGKKGALIRIVRDLYIVLILALVGSMLLHNLFDLVARLRERRMWRGGPNGGRWVLRWGLAERIQHMVLIVAFLVLAITGFMLKIPGGLPQEWPAAAFMIAQRGTLHRAAALVLIVLSAYHLLSLAISHRARAQWPGLRPHRGDFRELAGTISYLLGRRETRPPKGRFGYAEKFEYFSMVWGTAIMVTTGILLWLEEIWPLYLVDVARLIHAWEAILAVLAIVVWHLYFAHWRPGVFPMNRSWLDGRISVEELKREHPLEYERLADGEHSRRRGLHRTPV